jgi:hypothetical protein
VQAAAVRGAPAALLTSAAGLYLLWAVATWFFEGRVLTLLRPEATTERIVYAFVVNLLIGIGGAIVLVRRWRMRGVDGTYCGFGSLPRSGIAVAAGLALGFGFYVMQGAPSLDTIVLVNAFAQVLVVSAAEVLVCWAVVGWGTWLAARRLGNLPALILAAVVSSVLFGVYHFAHSPPFNTFAMVAFLSVIGLATSLFYFVSRDAFGTIVFHNFLGTYGVVEALAKADALSTLQALQPPLLFTAAVTTISVAAGYFVMRRASAR